MADEKREKKAAKAIASLGGQARSEKLTDIRKSEIAKKAALARWGEKPLRATHRGNFEEDFGIDVDCYVLDDEQKTAVISQRGMGEVLGMGESGSRLPRLLSRPAFIPHLGPELAEKLSKPLIFRWAPAGLNPEKSPPVKGTDVTVLIDLCKAIVKANEAGAFGARQAGFVQQAQTIINASAKAGIKGLVYKLAGYDATREEVVAAFKFYVREEAREYEKEFPDQLYEQWYRLYQLPRPEKNKPWKFRDLTISHVYEPLARSSGKVLQLTRNSREKSGERWKKLHQFLSEIGVKALRNQVGRLTGIAEVSADRQEYERNVNRIFGVQTAFDFL